MGLAVWVTAPGSFDDEAFGVVDGGRKGGSKEDVIVRHGIEGKAVDGEQEVSGGKAESLPGIIGDWERLIEAGGEGRERGV